MTTRCPKCKAENPNGSKFCKECGTQLTSSEGPQVSKTMTLETPAEGLTRGALFAGRYEIIEELGTGGMGSVYRAEDTKIRQEVALKLIRPEIASSRRTIERFRNEIKTARMIAHRNVCRMFDLGEEKGTYYITMEYVAGEDMKSFLRRAAPLSTGRAVAIGKQICEGLAEAHRLGVVHRDLKPGNIMIDKEGNARIMDFGIARSIAEKGITGTGVMIGTPEYMSPEQAEGKEADQRSDIYSLAVILFEMVTGRPPFEGETALSIAQKHRYELPLEPKKINPQIPDNLSGLILRCLEKEKEKRSKSASEVQAELEKIEQQIPITDRVAPAKKPFTSKEITVKFRLKKLFFPAAVLLMLAAIIVVFFKFLPSKKVAPSQVDSSAVPSVAILYFKNNTGDKNLDIWREGLSLSLITKLSQSRYFRVLDQSQIYGILKRLNLLEQDSFTPEELKEIASRGLATHIVRGSLSKAGEKFRIELTLQNASTLQIIAPESADGIGEESLFTMVDSLSDRLITNLGLKAQQEASNISKDIRDVTTSSIEAFKLYVQGCQFLLSSPLDFDSSAIAYFDKAVAADPQFAMAYLMAARDYSNLGNNKADPYIRRAYELRERVSEREKYLIEASYFEITSERTWDQAVEAYSKLIALYPWDLFSNTALGILYFLMDEWDKAIERLEVSRKYKDENTLTYHLLAWSYLAEGQAGKAQEALEDYLNNITDNNHIRSILGMVYCVLEDFDRAKEEIEKAYDREPAATDRTYKLFYLLFIRDFAAVDSFLVKSPDVYLAFTAFAAQGKIGEARANIERVVEMYRSTSEEISEGLALWEVWSAHFLAQTGDFPQALSISDRCLRSARELDLGKAECMALYRLGIIQARKGDLEEAERSAKELRRTVEDSHVKKRIRYYEGLIGLIALMKKDLTNAQAHFQNALTLAPIDGPTLIDRPEFLDFQAEAYELSGRWEDAKRPYEEIQSTRVSNLWPANMLIFVRSYYKLGKVLEQLGDNAGAVSKYHKFLDLWKDADPGIAEVEDARERLSALQ